MWHLYWNTTPLCPRAVQIYSIFNFLQYNTRYPCHFSTSHISLLLAWNECWCLQMGWSYLQCQRAKVTRHTFTSLGTFNTPDARFNHVHIDLVGPLLTSQGCTYLLMCIDWFTHWPEAFPTCDITADTVAQAFIGGWISRFGEPSGQKPFQSQTSLPTQLLKPLSVDRYLALVPSTITTDWGQRFKSSLWKHLMHLLGILYTRQIHTTAYHPIANELAERFHQQLKGAMKCLPDCTHWTNALPMIKQGTMVDKLYRLNCEALRSEQATAATSQAAKYHWYLAL